MEPKASWASTPVGGLSVLGNGPQLIESMTKRELLAAMAMQGILSNSIYSERVATVLRNIDAADAVAEMARECADALLAELAKGGAA